MLVLRRIRVFQLAFDQSSEEASKDAEFGLEMVSKDSGFRLRGRGDYGQRLSEGLLRERLRDEQAVDVEGRRSRIGASNPAPPPPLC